MLYGEDAVAVHVIFEEIDGVVCPSRPVVLQEHLRGKVRDVHSCGTAIESLLAHRLVILESNLFRFSKVT